MLLANPKIDGSRTSVPNLLNGIPRANPLKCTVDGTIPIPPWFSLNPFHAVEWHYQGIAPYNGDGATLANGCISASSTQGYFSGFSQASASGHADVRSVVVPDANYFHAAGIQMLGDLLPVPLERDSGSAKVAFYNVGNLAAPVHLYNLTMPANKASAVAITTYTDGSGVEQCILMVYQYDDHQMYIYRAPAAGLASASGWEFVHTYTGSAFDCGDQFQGFAMVTEQTSSGDVVYVMGFREDEELWLYSVDTSNGSNYGKPTLVTHYTGWNGSDWRNGMGLQIANPTTLRLFGTDKDPSGDSDYPNGPADYSFHVYVYGG